MEEIEWILRDLKQVRAYATDMLDHVAPDMWFVQPKPGINHLAWHVGHMAIAQYGLCLKRIRGQSPDDDQLLPVAAFGRLFGKGSVPSSNPKDYPEVAEIRRCLDAVHARVLESTAELTPTDLTESSGPPHPMFSTKGGALRFSPKHEMLHVGQIGLLRRLYDGEILR
jgi:uncharacterized damage-inducible protein DinB